MIDARSYFGTETASDHRVVVTRILLSWSKSYSNRKDKSTEYAKLNTNLLIHDPVYKKQYQDNLKKALENLKQINSELKLNDLKELYKKCF